MASFVGIVGTKPHALVCLVVLDDPTANGHTGGLAAAPAFAHIVRFALEDPSLPWGTGSVDAPGTLHAWLGQAHGRADSALQKRMREIAGSEAPG
jgi:hypothetical protein